MTLDARNPWHPSQQCVLSALVRFTSTTTRWQQTYIASERNDTKTTITKQKQKKQKTERQRKRSTRMPSPLFRQQHKSW